MIWTKKNLWKLRKQISLCSLFTMDFRNNMGVDPYSCQDFFDGYADYLSELMVKNNIDDDAFFENLHDYDNADNLWDWWNCYDYDPFKYEEEDDE